MSEGMSVFLDFLRLGASLMVVVGHLTQPYFSRGWPDLTIFGIVSVGVFFVLSGYVIAHTIRDKAPTPRQYFVARLARIYSVLIPAVGLTYALDTTGRYLNPDFYRSWVETASFPLLRVLFCLTFLNQAHGLDLSLSTNSPVWSLGYEVPYYVAFGILTFLRGWARIGALILAGAIWGLQVLFLFPLWLFGAWLYRQISRSETSKLAGLLSLAAAPIVMWSTIAANDLWAASYRRIVELGSFGGLIGYTTHGRAGFFILLCGGGLVTACLIVFAHAFDEELTSGLRPAARAIRRFASSTFSFYLYHFPILCFVAGFGFYRPESAVHKFGLLAFTLAVCFLLSRVTEAKKRWWQRAVDHGLRRLSPSG